MKKCFLEGLLACGLMASACAAMAASDAFGFAIIDHPFRDTQDDTNLRATLVDTDNDNLAFVVVNGIKARPEACSDAVYNRRKVLLDSAKNGLIVSLAASDWTDCKGPNGKSAAMTRLNRLRELFFTEDMSLGATRIPLVRQSTAVKFRNYGENARWEFGKAMFATINLPANNNHYLSEAGRNSEFEDRLIANRNWLNRVFTQAKLSKLKGIVLFCDGNPFARPGSSGKRDGFAEVRQQITALASRFSGKVLVVHGRTLAKPQAARRIAWRNNLGVLEAGLPWTEIRVDPASPALFSLRVNSAPEAMNTQEAAVR